MADHDKCDPMDFMSKKDCTRIHNEQKDHITTFMDDSKKDRADIWHRHGEVVESVNSLVRTISARTIQMLIVIVLGLIAFIVSNIYIPRSVPSKVYEDLNTLSKSLGMVIEQQQLTGAVSGDSNKILKDIEKKNGMLKGDTGAQGARGEKGEKGGVTLFGRGK